MKDLRYHSIVFQWGGLLGCIMVLALVCMGSSLLIAKLSKGDVASINQSGLLRMQSYKLLNQLMRHEQQPSATSLVDVQDSMIYLERLLNDELLKKPFAVSSTTLKTAYHDIHRQWYSSIKPEIQQELQNGQPNWMLHDEIARFVFQVNHMVTSYQKNSKKLIYLLELIAIITLTAFLFLQDVDGER